MYCVLRQMYFEPVQFASMTFAGVLDQLPADQAAASQIADRQDFGVVFDPFADLHCLAAQDDRVGFELAAVVPERYRGPAAGAERAMLNWQNAGFVSTVPGAYRPAKAGSTGCSHASGLRQLESARLAGFRRAPLPPSWKRFYPIRRLRHGCRSRVRLQA